MKNNDYNTAGYMRKAGAAEYMSVSLRTLSNLQRRRLIPFRKISPKIVLFKASDLDKALDKFRVAAAGEGV